MSSKYLYKTLERILFLSVLAGCTNPSQHDPARDGTVTLAFGPALKDGRPWTPDEIKALREEIPALNALGPTFIETNEATAQWIVRPFDSGGHCVHGGGNFTPGTRYLECDPACTFGFLALQQCMGHELGHALGMSHVCHQPGEELDCSPVGYGVAMMNPRLADGERIASPMPTELDLSEYRRTHP